MTTQRTSKTAVNWDQTAFEELKASWSPERVEKDTECLQKIFNLAAGCPIATAALEWAHQNGIQFFIDRTAINCGGYYTCGTGVVGITEASASFLRPSSLGVVVHEIRHAWQDKHGFIPYFDDTGQPPPDGFAPYFIKLSLIEADAKAFGNHATSEAYAAYDQKKYKSVMPYLKKQLENDSDHLAEKFLKWFSKWHSSTQFYGKYASRLLGERWGLPGVKAIDLNIEFQHKNTKINEGIDITHVESVRLLGESFSGTKNYLDTLQPDILPRQILSTARAQTFYGAARKNQEELTTAIRKASLKKKHAARKHPTPKAHLRRG